MAHVRMCLDFCHLQLIMIDRHLSAKSQVNCSRDNDNLAMESIAPQRDRQLIIDVIYKWHDAAASVMRITRRVLLAKRWWQQLPLCPTGSAGASGHSRRVELTQSDVQTKRVAQSRCICIWRRSPKSFFPADHCSALSIRPDRATDIYIYMFCVLGQPLCVPLTKYC